MNAEEKEKKANLLQAGKQTPTTSSLVHAPPSFYEENKKGEDSGEGEGGVWEEGGGEEPAFKRLEKRLPSSAQLFLSPARLRGAWIGKSCDAAVVVVVVVDVVLNADVVVKLAVAFQEDLGAEKTAAAVGERERERERGRERAAAEICGRE